MSEDIVTDRLILRLMSLQVLQACRQSDLRSASAVLGAAIPAELLEQPGVLDRAVGLWRDDPGYADWSARAVIHRDDERMVGHVRFHSTPDPPELARYGSKVVELAYLVFAAERRQGYAREAVAAALRWAEQTHGVRAFIASVAPSNAASLGLVESLGFRRIGEQIDEIDGLEHVFIRALS